MTKTNNQAILDVLNNLEVVDQCGGDDAYILVENSLETREKLNNLGVKPETLINYGDEETFCILALAFGEGYANFFYKKLVNWPKEAVELIEELWN